MTAINFICSLLKRLVPASLFLYIAIVPDASVLAQSYSRLFAITHDGFLLEINVSLSTPRIFPIRSQLSSQFRDIRGLTYRDGQFFATYIVNRDASSREGHVVRFGLTAGDEVDLGYTGYKWIEGIATRSDGKIYVTVSPLNGLQQTGLTPISFKAKGLGELNTQNGSVFSVLSPDVSTVVDRPEMFFDAQGAFWVLNWQRPTNPGDPSCSGGIARDLTPYAINTFERLEPGTRQAPTPLSALTMDPVTSIIYGFIGFDIVQVAGDNVETPIDSKFLRIGPEIGCPPSSYSQFPKSHLATANGFTGVTGLAVGPTATAVPDTGRYHLLDKKLVVPF